jgi:hypothetical protein
MLSGALDNLFVTPRGDLALVECKLWRNPEARRQVVAQIIDYAKEMSNWSYDTLQEAISRTRSLDAPDARRTRTLYEEVAARGEVDEQSFHDAVARNLRRGRFLLLIIGDGIREGAEALTEFLQQHAGFHFTLAIVELALFEVPTGGYIAQPRVLARTTNIDRGIVTLDEGHIAIRSPSTGSTTADNPPKRTTITQERFFEVLENNVPGISQRLNSFIDKLPTYNVSPQFGTDSMILRWLPDDRRSWNLGTIMSSGDVWMDYLSQQANNAGLTDLSQQYLRNLAGLIPGAHVRETRKAAGWYVAQDGRNIRIDVLLADEVRKEGWLRAISEFQAAVLKVSQAN